MLNSDYFIASDLKYKKIWLTRVLEASLRGHVEKKIKDIVLGLCNVYKINYNEVNKAAVEKYNKKVTFKYRLENTILNFKFRWFYTKWKYGIFVSNVSNKFFKAKS